MFFMPASVQLFWSHFSHFSEFPLWFRILCLMSILAPVSSFVVGILLSQPLVLIFTFLRPRHSVQAKDLGDTLPVIPNSILCPEAALTTYFSLIPASSDSPVFLAPHGSGFTPFLAQHFNLFLKCCVSSIGEDPTHFSSRSFRKGGATFAFNCGAPIEFIKAQGDWKSDASLVYLTLSSSKKTSPFERHHH